MAGNRGVAIVTGASRGIGKATCGHLAKRGFDVVVTARSVNEKDVTPFPGTIRETAALVESLGGRAVALRCDLAKNGDIERVVAQTLQAFGRIDVLINNARYEGPAHWEPFTEGAWSEVETLWQCNVFAPLYMTRLVLPAMRKQGRGVVMTVTSAAAVREGPNLPNQGSTSLHYPASKAAINRFVVALVKEVKDDNIAVINIDPGGPLNERISADKDYDTHGFVRNPGGQRATVHVPATCMAYIAACPDPMLFTGQTVIAPEFVRQHFLMTAEECIARWREGEIYDPYAEPYWLKVKAS